MRCAVAAPAALATPARRRALFGLLYFCEGAPFGYIWWTLPVLLREAGAGVADITLITSLATVPWTLKFVIGPVVDYTAARGVPLGYWIAGTQVVMALALVPLLDAGALADRGLLLACLMTHSVFAATQDVAIDALAMRTVGEGELGSINGWMQAGMLAGRALVSGAGLLAAARLGESAVVLGLIALLIGCAATVLAGLRGYRASPQIPVATLLADLVRIVRGAGFWIAAAFALASGAAFEALGALAGPLLVDHGMAREEIARVFAAISPAAMIAAALAGGALASRYGVARLCGAGVLGIAAAVALIAAASTTPGLEPRTWYALFAVFYLAVGLFTAVSYALFMTLAAGGLLAATEFSLFMALTNACEAWAGFAGGRLAERLGYAGGLGVMVLVSLAALALLAPLARRLGHAGP